MSEAYEVKALETVFEGADEVAELRAEVSKLSGRVAAMARPAISGGEDQGEERKAFVERYLRKGIESGVELKTLSSVTGADGGYAVPEALDKAIDAVLKNISPIRSIANVVGVGSANYKKLITTTGIVSGWVSEAAGRPETDTPDFAEVAPPMGELYANPAASQAMLDDAAFDVEGWLSQEIASEFARAEGAAFVSGTGVNRPRGFLAYPTATTADGVRPFGTLQYVPSGAAGAFAATDPADRLIDLVHKLRPPYRQGASFVMNSATLARVRKFKDGDGNFLWRPGLGEGQGATLLGYPVVEAEDMPDIAADSLSIAFGNFRLGYVVAERTGVRILRDPFTNKPFVHFYATKRVGGAVVNSEAIKLMKFAAS